MIYEIPFEMDGLLVRQNEAEEDAVDDTEPQPQEKMISETEMNKIMAAREKRIKQQFARQTKDLVTKDDLQDMLSSINSTDSSSGGGDAEDPKTTPETEITDKGVKAELSKLQTQLNRVSEENEKLQTLNDTRETEMKLERRRHSVESMLTEVGAVKPNQAFRILSDNIVEDSELGDAVKVKTPHGDDFIPVSDYIPQFKEENPHLFSNPARSGSGAGAGGETQNKPRFTADSLRDTREGGMSWEDYEKNRDKIIQDIQDSKGN